MVENQGDLDVARAALQAAREANQTAKSLLERLSGTSEPDWFDRLLELLKLAPSFAFLALIIWMIIRYRNDLGYVFQSLSGVKAFGMELSFARQAMDKAVTQRNHFIPDKTAHEYDVDIPEASRERALARAKRRLPLLQGARILWVDDIPTNNINERRMFRALGIDSEAVTTNHEALRRLQQDGPRYDVIISDIARENNNEKATGIDLANARIESLDLPPLVFYIGKIEKEIGVPAGAFGLTNRPDELLNYVIDIIEREHYHGDWLEK